MDKFEQQEMKKMRQIKKYWFDQLIKQSVRGKKPKIIRGKLTDKIISNIWKFFETKEEKRKKHNKIIIKDKIIRNVKTIYEQEKDYYKSGRVSNIWNNDYIEYERNVDKNRNLSLDEYRNEIKPYLRNITIDLQNSDAWQIQLTIAINFIW